MTELADLHRALGRIEGQLGEIAKAITQRTEDHEELDSRVREVERQQAHSAGKYSMLSALVSTVVAGIVAWSAKHFA